MDPTVIIVMGVSGCGKTTLGKTLAGRLDLPFIEGDDFHPPDNVSRMAAGIPLTDADRSPWLDTLAAAIRHQAGDTGAVVTCSALKRQYRDRLRQGYGGRLLFVLPVVGRDTLKQRLAARTGHYMPASLLDSQLSTLEEPGPDEFAVRVDGRLPLSRQIEEVLDSFKPQ